MKNKSNGSKYINFLKRNKNNIVVEFDDQKKIKDLLEKIRDEGPQIGYFIVNNFKVSDDIAKRLEIDNDLALMASKSKLSIKKGTYLMLPLSLMPVKVGQHLSLIHTWVLFTWLLPPPKGLPLHLKNYK